LREAAAASGLLPITPQAGETESQAIQRQVLAFLTQIVNGEANVIPLGAIGFALREQYGAEVFERSIPVLVRRVTDARPATGDPQMPMPQQQMPPPMPMPNSGN
jgi:hypothetical protein